MRFSIRDLLWATLVVAMGLGWWRECQKHRETNARRIEAIGQAQRHRVALATAKRWDHVLHTLSLQPAGTETPDWSILDEPLVEP
jgi:hypothetical protein